MRDQLNKGKHLSTPLKTKNNSFSQGGETRRMKTRKIMASLLAFAMLLSIVAVPVGSADAASNISVDRVLQVAKDATFTTSNAVYLRLEEKNVNDFKGTEAILELTLKNAEFLYNDAEDGFKDFASIPGVDSVEKVTKTKARLVLDKSAGTFASTNKYVWEIPLNAKVTEEGEVTVTVEGRDNFITPGTLTFAVSAEGGSIASIGSVKKFSNASQLIDPIILDETRIGSLASDVVPVTAANPEGLKGQKITLRLPNSDFEWDANNGTFDITFDGKSYQAGELGANVKIEGGGILPDSHERTLTISGLKIPKAPVRSMLKITGLTVLASSDAKFGDISVRISGDKVTSEDLVVAKYQDYGVTVSASDKDDVPELYAGRWAGSFYTTATDPTTAKTLVGTADFAATVADGTAVGKDEHELRKLTIEETSDGAWLTNRRTRIEFPAGVKIIGVEEKFNNQIVPGSGTRSDLGKNYVEYSGYTNLTGTGNAGNAKLELVFYVSVAADFAGDIVAKVSGNALLNEETEVVLGKAVAPVTVEAGSVDLRIGVLNQATGDIIITEVEAGSILEKKQLVITLGDKDYFRWEDKPKVEVIEGDLELETKAADIVKSGNTVSITVKSESSKASKIRISGATVTLDRSVPEGVFSVKVGGSALVENNSSVTANQNNGSHSKGDAASFKALNVITPAPGEERRTVKFNLDSKEYVVIEAGKEITKTMDVAPYNESGRALLPIRFVAEALGVNEDNIVWNANTKEVTIFKGDRVAKVAIGSNVLVVNGTQVVMDTTAAIKDGRTVLPIRFVGQALGANIGWDDATRTITVQQ